MIDWTNQFWVYHHLLQFEMPAEIELSINQKIVCIQWINQKKPPAEVVTGVSSHSFFNVAMLVAWLAARALSPRGVQNHPPGNIKGNAQQRIKFQCAWVDFFEVSSGSRVIGTHLFFIQIHLKSQRRNEFLSTIMLQQRMRYQGQDSLLCQRHTTGLPSGTLEYWYKKNKMSGVWLRRGSQNSQRSI